MCAVEEYEMKAIISSLFDRRRKRSSSCPTSSKPKDTDENTRNLRKALLENYVRTAEPVDHDEIFSLSIDGEERSYSVRQYVIGNPVKHYLPEHVFLRVLSFLDGKSLLRCCAVSRQFFIAADTPCLYDALDGLYDWKSGKSLVQHSMGRYDYRFRHKRRYLSKAARDSRQRFIKRSEHAENFEKRYRAPMVQLPASFTDSSAEIIGSIKRSLTDLGASAQEINRNT